LREKRGIQTKVRLKQHHPNTISQLVSVSQGHHRKKLETRLYWFLLKTLFSVNEGNEGQSS